MIRMSGSKWWGNFLTMGWVVNLENQEVAVFY
jgi:hypothetical protein